MATSTYDVNLQLVLATTAEAEGDLDMALELRLEALRLAFGGRNDEGPAVASPLGSDTRSVTAASLLL
jgi:hypothetical protein